MINLRILKLNSNQIDNLEFLKNLDLKELKELDLNCNQISDINVLEEVKFGNLDKLDIRYNKIDLEEDEPKINVLKYKIKELKYKD